MERVGNPNVDTKAASEGSKSIKDPVKIPQSNPFDALCDGDSGDDAVVKAAEQLKQASVSPKPDKSKKGKEKVNNTVASANNVNSRGGYSNGPRGHVNNVNSRGGYPHYQNSANGQRGGYYNHYQNQYGANGQRGPGQTGGFNGYNNKNQNPLYRTESSSRSSNGTDDGASDNAERSSVKSERELREEEFQKKLKDFKYDPEKEDEHRKFLAKFPEILNNKSAEEREVLLKQKADALEDVRLADSKKMTLDEYEKMKEEQRKALRASNTEMRVVESSEFEGLVVVSKKNLEEDDSLSLTSVHKQKIEAEKTEKSQKMKKKKNTPLLVFGGSQSQGHFFAEQQDQPRGRGGYNRGGYQGQGRNFSEQQDQPRGRGGHQGRGRYSSEQQGQPRGRGAGTRPQVQSVKQNGGVPSLSLDSQDNFPGLRSAPGA